MELDKTIIELSEISAPAGFEEPVAREIEKRIKPLVDECYTDPLGNLLAVKHCGKPGAKRLMLTAHMDEIGMIVTGHDDGFLRIDTSGTDKRMLPAREVKILTEPPIFGVVGAMPPHVLKKEDFDKVPDEDSLFIDTGLSGEEAKKLIPLGTLVTYADGASHFGDSQITGKALDDRSCCAIIIKVLEELQGKELDTDLCVLFSVQEEAGRRGAGVGTYSLEPDYAIVFDVTFAQQPDCKETGTFKLGEGPTIGVGPQMNRGFSQKIMDLATELDIPFHIEVLSRDSGTDCREVQVSRGGVCTALISLPLKYMHSPVETIDIGDAEKIVKLTTEVVTRMEELI